MVMLKTVLEGAEILSSPPHSEGIPRTPIITLQDGLILDDRMFEAPTLLLGAVGSGKSLLLEEIMQPILRHAETNDENIVISTNQGEPLVGTNTPAGKAYANICRRVMGENVPFMEITGPTFFQKLANVFKK